MSEADAAGGKSGDVAKQYLKGIKRSGACEAWAAGDKSGDAAQQCPEGRIRSGMSGAYAALAKARIRCGAGYQSIRDRMIKI